MPTHPTGGLAAPARSEPDALHLSKAMNALRRGVALARLARIMNAFASLEKLLDPEHPCFTPETAANVLRLEPDLAKAKRIEELSPKANEGRLTPAEEAEYWSYIHAGKMISMLKLQARLFLQRHAG